MFINKQDTIIDKFTGNPEWNPPKSKCSPILSGYGHFLQKKIKKLFKSNKVKHNISTKERESLKALGQNKNIFIQKADKGGSITILKTADYVAKINTMLADAATYTRVDNINLPKAKEEVDKIIRYMYQFDIITKKQKNFLTRCIPKLPVLYGLPKIHKENWPLRPIVSQIDSPAYKLNKFLDYLLTTAEKEIPNLLQDTTKFLQIIQTLPSVNANTLLFTIDVTSLYTVLPHTMVMDYVEEMYKETLQFWDKYTPDISPIPVSLLRKIISVILNQTFFSFNSCIYTQNYGITMGAPSSVKLANITLFKHLQKRLPKYTGKQPLLQLRLIDDVFGLFEGSQEELLGWVKYLNDCHPTIKFTIEISKTEIPFLDTLVYVDNGKIKTKLYKKPTDNKQYLHFDSEHPQHVKNAIPYAQALRYRRIIEDDDLLDVELNKLQTNFLARSYPKNVVMQAINRAKALDRNSLLVYKTRHARSWDATPFVLTFSNSLVSNKSTNVHKILTDSWSQLVLLDGTLSGINPPKVVFKKCTTINSLLVSTKFPPQRWSGSNNYMPRRLSQSVCTTVLNKSIQHCEPCGSSRCLTCKTIETTSTFTSTTFCKTHRLKSNVNCGSTNLIYLITCQKCDIQYVGETGTTLRKRFNHHRSCIALDKSNPIGIHFNSIGHDITHLRVTPIETLAIDSKSFRLSREAYWQLVLGTIFPKGLNKFPVQQRELFTNLSITSPTDLIAFWDIVCIAQENDSQIY
jgi:hypothetical protein